jgi:hypothetical protein
MFDNNDDIIVSENMKTMERQQFTANYLHPTLSSSLPPFVQGEVERIRSSYRTGSFWSIKGLPAKLEPGTVQLTRKQHTIENLLSNSENIFKPTSRNQDVFHPQVYVGTDYDKVNNLNKNAIEEEKIRIDSYSRKPFVITSRVRAKNEDLFHNPDFRFPHIGGSTGVFKLESITRSDVLDQDKFLNVPMSAKTSAQVRGWLHALHDRLAEDWPQYLFKVKFTATEEVLVQFERPNCLHTYTSSLKSAVPAISTTVAFPPPNNLLGKYMQKVATLGIAYEFGLRKRGDRWNVFEVDYPESSPSVGADTIPSVDGPDTAQRDPPHNTGSREIHSANSYDDRRQQHEGEAGDRLAPLRSSMSVVQQGGDNNLNWHVPGASSSSQSLNRTVNFTDAAASAANAVNNATAGSPIGSTAVRSGSFLPLKHNSMSDLVGDIIKSPSLRDLVIGARNSNRLLLQRQGSQSSVGSGDISSVPSRERHSMRASSGIVDTASQTPDDGSMTASLHSDQSSGRGNKAKTKSAVERAKEQQQLLQFVDDDQKVYLLTFAFYAPWVNTQRLTTFRHAASKNRQLANTYGKKFKSAYRENPSALSEIPVASSKPVRIALNSATAAPVATVKAPTPLIVANVPPPLASGYLTKFVEHDEMSFGTHGSDATLDQLTDLPLPAADLSSFEEQVVARAVAQVGGGTATGFNSTTGSGSTATDRSRMSIRRSLKSFSKSSFSHDHHLIHH